MPHDQNLVKRLPPRWAATYHSTELDRGALATRFGDTSFLRTEEGVSRVTGASPVGQSLAGLAKRALQAYTGIREAHFRSMGDRSTDETAAFLRSAKAAKKWIDLIEAEHDRLLVKAEAEISRLNDLKAGARKAPSNIGEAMIDAEVRAILRATTDPAKAGAIARANPRAVATAPAITSGMQDDGDSYNSIVDSHLRATIPDVMSEWDDLGVSFEWANRAHANLMKETRKVIDFDLAASLEQGGQWQAPNQEHAA